MPASVMRPAGITENGVCGSYVPRTKRGGWRRAYVYLLVLTLVLVNLDSEGAPTPDVDSIRLDDALSISKTSIACYSRAESVISIHKAHKAPLEPSEEFSPTLSSRALLGLVVQVRGPKFVHRDLSFELNLHAKGIDRIYPGFWKGTAPDGRNVAAKTTDWWVNLEKFFSPAEVDAVCADPDSLVVKLRRHSFSNE